MQSLPANAGNSCFSNTCPPPPRISRCARQFLFQNLLVSCCSLRKVTDCQSDAGKQSSSTHHDRSLSHGVASLWNHTVTSIIPGYVKSDYVANSLTESERCELYLRPSCKQKLRPSQCICKFTLLFQCVSNNTHQLFCGLFCRKAVATFSSFSLT